MLNAIIVDPDSGQEPTPDETAQNIEVVSRAMYWLVERDVRDCKEIAEGLKAIAHLRLVFPFDPTLGPPHEK